jgi:hypothetical protein
MFHHAMNLRHRNMASITNLSSIQTHRGRLYTDVDHDSVVALLKESGRD